MKKREKESKAAEPRTGRLLRDTGAGSLSPMGLSTEPETRRETAHDGVGAPSSVGEAGCRYKVKVVASSFGTLEEAQAAERELLAVLRGLRPEGVHKSVVYMYPEKK